MAIMGFALALLAGRQTWTLLSGGKVVNYDAAPFRPVQFRVNLNDATWPELSQLPGIGETLARRIVASREHDGPFRTIDDLRRVPGVGSHTLSQIRPYLEIKTTVDSGRR